MPASKRRRAAARSASARAVAADVVTDAATAEPAPVAATPTAAAPAARRRRLPVAEPDPAPAAPRRRPPLTDPDSEPQWSRRGLLVLLALVFVVQIIVGAIGHLIANRPHRLLVVDMFFFQALYVLPACVVVMPLAKRLTHQPRNLRLLEALSLGAVFALLALLLTSIFVRPSVASSLTTDQVIDGLKLNDAGGIVIADILSMLGAVQLYPGLNRFLGAPGRRARKRMLERSQGTATRGAAGPRKPAARPRTSDPGKRR